MKEGHHGKNVDFWEALVASPTGSFRDLFAKEKLFFKGNIDEKTKVLDVGCGHGRNIDAFATTAEKIVGLDIDSNAIAVAKERFKDNQRVEIVEGSAFDLPFADASFDAVTLSLTLVNFSENKYQSLKEIARVLKPGGALLLSVYSEDSLEKRLEAYKKVGIPMDRVDESGTVVFAESVGANVSEAFSIQELGSLAQQTNLKIDSYEKVDKLAYLLKLVPVQIK